MPNTDAAHSSPHDAAPEQQGSTASSEKLFSNILCAVDGTAASIAGVKVAASLAGADGHLTLLAVTAVTEDGHHAAAISPTRAERFLERAKRIADDAGVPATTIVDPDGPPVEVILARAHDHDLLTLGAPAISWLGGMIIGGVSSSFGGLLVGGVTAPVLSRRSTPMLVVRDTDAGSLRGHRILVASDGAEGSDRLVELAGRLGQSQGAQVTIVNALVGESNMNPRAIQAQAHALELMLPDSEKPRIEPGKPWDVILDDAKSTGAALIVIGSRRLSGIRALGSVSRRAVHDAPCSVLVVPPETPES